MAQCANCGAFVSPDFVRVFGTNGGTVYGCPDCTTLNGIRVGEVSRPDS